MRDYLFTANEKNAFDLQKEYNLSDNDTGYIERMFWPIIVLTDISQNDFEALLENEKQEFINKRRKFVLKIFKRDNLDFLVYEIKEYLDNINKGKNKIYRIVNNIYFHWFKLNLDSGSYTLLLSKKDITDLEIYFIDLLNIIELFISENEALPTQQNAKQKPELSKIWLSEPQVTVSEFLIMGIEKGIWNEQYNIITARGSLYGTGKSLLGSLFIALKGYAISNSIDYKEAGKAFCSFFNIPISENVKEPYKDFSSRPEKQIKQLKKAFNIK